MDKASSILAALDAGKLPSQQQITQFIDWLQTSGISSVEPTSTGGELSVQGKVLAGGARELLEAYKQLGANKNGDNLFQQALWHLSAGDLSNTTVDASIDKDQIKSDAEAIRVALRTLLQVVWGNVSSEGTFLSNDFASFARLSLADVAESVEATAGRAKEGLRGIENEVQDGQRDSLGRKNKTDEEKEQEKDPKVQWEKGIDSVKGAGSAVIGAGQDAKASAEDLSERTRSRLQEAYYKACDRAQSDPEYRSSLSTLFDTVQKWITKSLDKASDVNSSTSLDSFIQDPTPEKHTIQALHTLRTLAERLSGEKSLDDLFAHARLCAVDIRADKDLKEWFEAFFAHIKKSLDEAGYARSDASTKEWDGLSSRWKELLDNDTDAGKKWKTDVAALRHELSAFEEGLDADKDLKRVRRANAKFGKDIQDTFVQAGSTGLQIALDQAAWFWQDLFKVYVPRLLNLVKDIPIPRTEYKDDDIEFVLENLDISSLNLLPSHVYIRNITDVDITAPASASASTTTAVGTLTHVRAQALQLSLKEISFWYKDKRATIGPSEFTGLAAFNLPAQGVDVDIKVRLIPNTPEGLKTRAARSAFHQIEIVEVHIAQELELQVTQSNHSVMLTMFKPIVVMRLREALEKTLTEQIRGALVWADGVAWDVAQRAEVFSDTGLSSGLSYAAALWSEVGRLQKLSGGGGVTKGWRATGTGLINESVGGPGAVIAMGAEPQILSGDKRGPLGTFSQPIGETLNAGAQKLKEQTGVNVQDRLGDAQGVVDQAKGAYKEGVKQVKSFRESVDAKAVEERRHEGWESNAFDV